MIFDGNTITKKVNEKKPLQRLTYLYIFLDKRVLFRY
jgi:hypothetical protein